MREPFKVNSILYHKKSDLQKLGFSLTSRGRFIAIYEVFI
ncbi:protein of unknown function [Brochothrix thermosphacta]|nr:protein of unknown function [Brochothrix thermosphacta]